MRMFLLKLILFERNKMFYTVVLLVLFLFSFIPSSFLPTFQVTRLKQRRVVSAPITWSRMIVKKPTHKTHCGICYWNKRYIGRKTMDCPIWSKLSEITYYYSAFDKVLPIRWSHYFNFGLSGYLWLLFSEAMLFTIILCLESFILFAILQSILDQCSGPKFYLFFLNSSSFNFWKHCKKPIPH